MKARIFFLSALFSLLAITVHADETYYLQSTTTPGQATGDFYTEAGFTQTVNVTYDAVNYTKAVKFGGNITSITSNNYPDRMIRYDCKTTQTDFIIVAYANSNGKKMYVGDIKESEIGSANTITNYTAVDLTNGSITTKTYSINSTTPASLFVSAGANNNAFVVQIIAVEKGTPLPKPGDVGYKLNFNKTRLVARSGNIVWLDTATFEYCSNENITAGNTTKIKMQTKGTHYIRFRCNQPSIVEIGINGVGNGFYVADSKNGADNPIFFPKTLSDGLHEVRLEEGWHYIVPNGSNMYVSSLNIKEEALRITYDANGGTGTMNTQLASPGETVQLRENEFTKTDYKFKGWTTDPAGTGEVIADAAMYIMGNSNTTLYAKWEEITYTTITLDATGAYNNYTHSVIATSDEPMPEIATLPARANYVFDGYYDQPNGAGTQYYTGLGAGVRNWDKTSPTATLYAKWLAPCDLVPTLTNVTPIISIWDQKKVDVGVVRLSCEFDTTGIEYMLQSVSPATPIDGCHFEYFDEQIHLMGTPNINNSSTQSVNVTFTMANNCSPASTYNITQTIRIYPQNQKAKVAFIITGTKGGGFDAYTASDASSCNTLVNYLGNYYDITFVNGYATKDADALATYYAQYDLLVVTDFLNTGEGYTNAIGTLIDKKPILSFEAYVASQSNWHIGSNPRDPKPKVQDMKVLCAGHAIFKNAKYNPGDASDTEVVRSDTTVHVLSSLSSDKEAKGLQGFVINEAPDFIFLATVRDADNNRDLIVCCERQMVFPARLLIYGINFHEMPNLSPSGKIIMRQMIDYLLMTDETKIADCSLVFDNKSGDHKWDNPANWAPGYNIIPTPYHPTRIIAECWVNVDNAHAGSVKVNKGRDEHNNPVDGKLIIKPYGGLTVAGVVTKVNDTRYASPLVIKAEDLLIEADDSNNGALVYGNKESDVRATVQYYSRGEGAGTANPVWQYIGIPFQAGKTAISMYREAWMCRWSSATTDGLGGLWQWVNNEDVLLPFEGYCITQADKKTYEFAGKLNAPVTKTISLDNRDADGFAFAANSWTAPIKIKEMQDADFTNVEKSIYIYHTGTYASWDTNKDNIVNTQTNNSSVVPGQYTVVPIHSAPYIGVDSVIPAMQGFFVQTTSADAKLKLVYNRVVYDATYFKTSTQPMRAPKRAVVLDEPEVMQLTVSGESQGDRVHLLSQSAFSESFEDGWDGRKIEGDTAHASTLAVVKEAGKMAVAAVPSFEERYLSFRAGEDTVYTFSFTYDGEPIYLYDQVTEQATQIKTGNTYSFSASNKTPAQRFLITKNPPLLPMDISLVETEGILHFENYANEPIEVRIVDMQGRVVWTTKSSDEIVDIAPSLPYGVYLAHIKMGSSSKVIRIIGKEGAR